MNELYPLRFTPILLDKIWGGQRMKNLGYDISHLPNCGEAWLISGIQGKESRVSEGWLKDNTLPELLEVYMEDLVGDKIYEQYGEHFPLLVKILDSNDWLSIQVHPDDQLAQQKGFPNGKTEMWYVMQAEEGAEIITGFSRDTTRREFEELLNSKELDSVLQRVQALPDDIFFTPSGRIHALGPGIMLAEIQQSSDLTYRVYDFDRPGLDGQLRELHQADALQAIDYSRVENPKIKPEIKKNHSNVLVDQDCFTTRLLCFNRPLIKDLSSLDSFSIYLCIKGSVKVESSVNTLLSAGDAVLIPSIISSVKLIPLPSADLIEIYIR